MPCRRSTFMGCRRVSDAGAAERSTSESRIAPPGPDPTSASRPTPISLARARAAGEASTTRPDTLSNGAVGSLTCAGPVRGSVLSAGSCPSRDLALRCQGNAGLWHVRPAKPRQRRTDRECLAWLRQKLGDLSRLEDLDLDSPLLGFDHGDNIAARHLVAWCDKPLDELSLFHVSAQRRHREDTHDFNPGRAFTAATMSATCGRAACSRCFG